MAASGPASVGIQESKPLTDSETKAISTIKAKFGSKVKEHRISDGTLLRFVRGYAHMENALQVSLDKVDSLIKWREEKKVDEIVRAVYPKLVRFQQIWPTGIHGVSKSGHPVYYERIGKMDPSVLETEFTMDEVICFHIQAMERLCTFKDKLAYRDKRTLYKHIAVLDLNGIGSRHMSNKFYGPMKQFISIDQDKYPETLFCMVILNAPFLFRAFWAIISPWLDPVTKQRILFGVEELEKLVDKSQIPKWTGGTCTRCDGKCLEAPYPGLAEIEAVVIPEEKEEAKEEAKEAPKEESKEAVKAEGASSASSAESASSSSSAESSAESSASPAASAAPEAASS